MASKSYTKTDITFRKAKPADAVVAGSLIYATFPKVATFLIGLDSEDRAKLILEKLFALEGHRFSYEVTELALYQGRVIGLMVMYPGRKMGQLDRRLNKLVLKQYRFRGKLALIVRAWPLMFVKEVSRKEFVLGNIAVRNRHRGKGAGTLMLAHVETLAREQGLSKVALQVALENQAARLLYERQGYKTNSVHLEPNTRVPHMGAGYRRMIKVLDK